MTTPKLIGPDDEYLEIINRIVPTASPMGAYAVGIVSVMAWRDGVIPSGLLIEAAADCKTIKQAQEVYREWFSWGRMRQ